MRLEDVERVLSRADTFAPVRLSPAWEAEFRQDEHVRQRCQIGFGLAVGIAFYVALLPLQRAIMPDILAVSAPLQLGFGVPSCLVLTWVAVHPRFGSTARQWAVAVIALIIAATFSMPLMWSADPIVPVLLSADLIILAFLTQLVGVTTLTAGLISIAVTAILVAVVAFSRSGSPSAAAVYLTVAAMVGCACGLANWCIWNERRRNFLTVRRDAARLRLISEQRDLLETLAAVDPLTGLANRRGFDALIGSDAEAAGPEGSLTIAMIDVDHFKAFNDTYGHLRGDDVLRAVAEALVCAAGPHARVGRLGGEEFAVAVAGLDPPQVLPLGDRLRASVEGLAIPHAGSSTTDVVTISLGLARGCPGRDAVGRIELFANADRALYAAKRAGRNRALSAVPSRPERSVQREAA